MEPEFRGALDDEEGIAVVIDGRESAGIERGQMGVGRFDAKAPGVVVSHGPGLGRARNFPDEEAARAWCRENADALFDDEAE